MLRRDAIGVRQRKIEDEVQLILAIAKEINIIILAHQHSVTLIFIYDHSQFLH